VPTKIIITSYKLHCTANNFAANWRLQVYDMQRYIMVVKCKFGQVSRSWKHLQLLQRDIVVVKFKIIE